jgi:hypothetical protein
MVTVGLAGDSRHYRNQTKFYPLPDYHGALKIIDVLTL